MKNFNSFLFESTSKDFAKTYNNNLAIAFDSLISLVDLNPARTMPGSEDYERVQQEAEKRKFRVKKKFFEDLSKSENLDKALRLAVFEASKYYNAIKNKLDPNRQIRAEQKAAEIGKAISLPGMPYEPQPIPEVALKREPVARYFLESIIVLQDIANELKRPGFEELGTQLFTEFKSYFANAARQQMSESSTLNEASKELTGSFLALFPDVNEVVESYRTQINSMLATINSVMINADTDAPVTKYQGFADTLSGYKDWLSDPNSFSLAGLEKDAWAEKSKSIKNKVSEIGKFISSATAKGGTYSNFIIEASKPVSLGLGQFDRMLGESSRFLALGIQEMNNLQTLITNIWKSSRVFKGFGSEDIQQAVSALIQNAEGGKEEDLKSALKKKVGGKGQAKGQVQIPKLPKLQTPETSTLKSEELRRALSPLTDFNKDMQKRAEDEKAFNLSTRIIGNPQGLPNLRALEARFLQSGENK